MPALIVDPELIAAVTRQFNLRGELQPFNLTENVVPIFDIGRLVGVPIPQEVVTPTLANMVAAGHSTVTNPHYASAPPDMRGENVNSLDTNPLANAVLADTGQLAAGLRWQVASLTTDQEGTFRFILEHRNAADSSNIDAWEYQVSRDGPVSMIWTSTFLVDERVKWVAAENVTADVSSNVASALSPLDIAS